MQYSGLAWTAAPFDPQRASPADGILQKLEDDHIPDREVVERGPFLEVAAMEVDLAAGSESDETVPLSDHQLHETADGCGAASFRRSRRAAWRRLSVGGSRRQRHSLTSAVLGDYGRRRSPHHWRPPWVGPRSQSGFGRQPGFRSAR